MAREGREGNLHEGIFRNRAWNAGEVKRISALQMYTVGISHIWQCWRPWWPRTSYLSLMDSTSNGRLLTPS